MKNEKFMSQMKGQDKAPEKQLNAVEIGNLQEKEFRIMTVEITQDLWKRMEKIQELLSNDLKELKNRDTLEGIHSRTTVAEEKINDLEDRMVEITDAKQNI